MANDLNVKLGADIKGLQDAFQKAGTEFERLEKKFEGLQRAGDKMQGIGKKLSVGITLPLVALGTLAVKTFADFSQEMAKVRAISGATEEEFQTLKKSAEDLGSATRFSATEVAGLQLNLAKLGFNTKAITDSTGAILDLALATGEDLAQSAEVAASVMQGFGLEASEAGRVADVMATSFSASALDLNKFKIAMASVAPVASRAGQSIESTTGLLSILTNTGLEASVAGTSLRNIFLQLSKQGLTMEDAFDSINKSADKSKRAMELFGVQGATAAVVLAENADVAKDFTKQYQNAGGQASKMAAIMDNTLTGSLANLKSAIEGALIAIGEQLAPAISKLASFLTGLISRFKELSPQMQKTIVVIGGIAAAVGPVLVGLGGVLKILPLLGTAFTVLTGPIGLVVAALAAVGYVVYKHWDKIKGYVLDSVNWFIELYNESAVVRAGVEILALTFKNQFAVIKGVLSTAWEVIKSFAQGVVDSFKGVGQVIKGAFTGDWEMIKEGAKQVGSAYKNTWQNVGSDIITGVKDVANDIRDNTEKAIDNITKGKRDIVTELFTSDKSSEDEAVSSITDSAEDVIERATENLGRARVIPINITFDSEAMKEGLIDVSNFVGEKIPEIVQKADEAAIALAEWSQGMHEELSQLATAGLGDLIGGTFDAIGVAMAEGGNVMQAAGSAALGMLGGIMQQFGKSMIAWGVAKIALDKLFSNPFTAIAAGAGLIALGAAIKATSAKTQSSIQGIGGGGGGGSAPSTSSNTSSSSPRQASQPTSTAGASGGTYVFEIEGQKLIGVLKNTMDRNRRSGGNLSFS